METFEPTGSCRADRHCEHDKLQIEDAAMEAIRWFSEIGLTDVALVGGKGANLGELTAAGLPVPPGFVVTAAAYPRPSRNRARGRGSRAS